MRSVIWSKLWSRIRTDCRHRSSPNRETRAMASMTMILRFLAILVSLDQLAAQAPASPRDLKPITCVLPNTSMISPSFCTYYDKQNMASKTGNCQAYLTNLEDSPNGGCCAGLNDVAYYRTACLCDATFYPPVTVNSTRQLELPRLCGVTTDLCTHCLAFLVTRTEEYPVGGVGKRSTAAKVAAIVLGVILSVTLLAGAVVLSISEYRKRKAKQNAPEVFQAPPPGGAF